MRRFRDIIEDNKAPNIQNLWLNNGDLKVYGNKGWTPLNATSKDRQELEEKVDSLDKEVGQIKKDLSIFGSEQGVVELAIGNSESIKEANLSKLKTIQSNDHTFFTDINYGYGTASWLPTTGGNALIITDEGHAVKYSIATKTSLGGVKAITNIVNLAESTPTAQVVGAVNTLLDQFRSCGLIQL